MLPEKFVSPALPGSADSAEGTALFHRHTLHMAGIQLFILRAAGFESFKPTLQARHVPFPASPAASG
jgi:hypothetical protein